MRVAIRELGMTNFDIFFRFFLPECGKLSSNKIQGNDTTRLLQEPWQVAVYERLKDHLIYSCAGALVEEKLVLISAACFDRTTDPMKFMVVVNPSDGNLTANAADNSTLFADVSFWFLLVSEVSGIFLNN